MAGSQACVRETGLLVGKVQEIFYPKLGEGLKASFPQTHSQ